MDPNLFHIDWERTFEALMLVIILAFLIERALAVLFEHRWFIERFDQRGIKEIIALVTSVAVCIVWQFDAFSMIILTEETTVPGYILTGAVVAGGSKASVKLFHDLLNMKSTAYENRHEIRANTAVEEADSALKASANETDPRVIDRLARRAKRAKREALRSAQSSGSAITLASAAKAVEAANVLEARAATATAEVNAKITRVVDS